MLQKTLITNNADELAAYIEEIKGLPEYARKGDNLLLFSSPDADRETLAARVETVRRALPGIKIVGMTTHRNEVENGFALEGEDYSFLLMEQAKAELLYYDCRKISIKDAGQKFILKFEGVYCHAMVYVNEQLAGSEANGYTGFYVDLTPWLHAGDNEIRVQVKNAGMTNSRWYSGSGIYRDVYLLSSEMVYIEPDGVQVITEDCTPCQDFVYRKWNDVLFADNKDGLFVSYQWYADSIAISGATEQFYRLTDTLTPHLYYVEATMTNGRVRTSCVQLFEQFAPSAPQHPAQSARLILRDGQLYIKTEDAVYDIFGRRY